MNWAPGSKKISVLWWQRIYSKRILLLKTEQNALKSPPDVSIRRALMKSLKKPAGA